MPATNDALSLSRDAIRREMRSRRRSLTSEQQQQAALQLAGRAMRHPRVLSASALSLFLSFDGELDTGPLIERLWQAGKRVFLPVLHPFSPGHLLFLAYTPDTPMRINAFGIREPRLDVRHVMPACELDIVFTPLVAFDDRGQRLGMGGGFYDRTLANWQRRGPYPIGLAHDCQRVDALPAQRWDVPLPEIITPGAHYRWDP